MASLSPPQTRHRASSTSLRPPLTISTCGRRRSNSDLPTPHSSTSFPELEEPKAIMQEDSSLNIPAKAHNYLAKATFAEFYTRFMELLHIAHKESGLPSTPSSPRYSRSSLSTDDSILPIASPVVPSFGDTISEKPFAKSTSWWQGSPSVRSAALDVANTSVSRPCLCALQVHTPVFFVIALFPLSTALLLFCMYTLPITNSWPRNLTDLAQLGRELHGYSQSGPGPMAHVIGVLSVVVAWNHAWSIPGSVLWVCHTTHWASRSDLTNEHVLSYIERPRRRAVLPSIGDAFANTFDHLRLDIRQSACCATSTVLGEDIPPCVGYDAECD